MDKNQRLLNGTFDRPKKLSTSTWGLNGYEVTFKNKDISSDDQLTCEDGNRISSKQDHAKTCVCFTINNCKQFNKFRTNPKFYDFDYVRIAQLDLPFRKFFEQFFTEKILKQLFFLV